MRSLADRFWEKVDRSGGPDACWPWTRSRLKAGYGQFSVPTGHRGSAPAMAHRVAFELTNGPLAPGLLVRHTCDNPPCCNPGHLISGSDAENTRDMIERGRARTALGESHPASKLTVEQVVEMRRRHGAGESMSALAREYGVHIKRVSLIVRRLAWRHVA